jgi:two-component system cell cycle response regulator DivK
MSKNDRAEFRITALPNDTSDDRAVEKSRATPNSTQRLPLLVVEDDPDTQAFMKALLGRHYDVTTAASEEEFWSVLKTTTPCLILMDISLKGSQDGLTLTRRFRADPKWNAVPVVALTAHATTEDRERALEAGCALYVSKPVDRRRLLELIRSLLAPESAGSPGDKP